MPELPDITIYIEALAARVVGQPLERVRLASPFVLRSVTPELSAAYGKKVREMLRLGKRIIFALDDDLYLVLHLMISGRLRWGKPGDKIPGKIGVAAFDFPTGSVLLTEASTKKRASLHVVAGKKMLLDEFDRGGLEVLEASLAQFTDALRCENHTVKRSLTDPRLFSGIGNAYSDEILHRAQLSPMRLTSQMSDEEIARLFAATRASLVEWTEALRKETGSGFPEKVTAFRPGMAVHGRYQKPCPRCGAPVQRIRYAENETNYCAPCQTGGKLLADRGLSRLLKSDWPRTLEEMEALRRR